MYYCPRCESRSLVIESRKLVSGDQTRRLACQNPHCAHRWTERQPGGGPPPKAKTKPRAKGKGRGTGRGALGDDQLRMILERQELNNTQLARILDCTPELVRQVRAGLIYRDRLPRIQRSLSTAQRESCQQCVQWLGYCSLGFPDPLIEGPLFASECSAFAKHGTRPALKQASAETSPAAAAR